MDQDRLTASRIDVSKMRFAGEVATGQDEGLLET